MGGRRDQPGATASGLRHMGIAGGHRGAGAPHGAAGDLGSMVIVPHRARRGPSATTGTGGGSMRMCAVPGVGS